MASTAAREPAYPTSAGPPPRDSSRCTTTATTATAATVEPPTNVDVVHILAEAEPIDTRLALLLEAPRVLWRLWILEKDGVMPSKGKYPDEVRERAVRMVLDHEHEYGSQWEAICSVAEQLGPRPRPCGCGSAGRRPMRAAGLGRPATS